MNKLVVFLPCYNEELNIGALIDEWMNESAKLEK
jgi:glycosyltransferase involved in cell wall biosynthesis